MSNPTRRLAWLALTVASAASSLALDSVSKLPVRGLHLSAPAKRELPAALQFIRESLPKEGVNTLILEFDYDFDFQSRPEFGKPSALGKQEVQQIAAACHEKGIQLIPQLNCLGHQSWSRRTAALLTKHPEFDETPGKYPGNTNIYCRSYCPLHPEVHAVVFDLIDELAKACDAKAFHIGMDEVFILADPDCPRCKTKTSAEMFAEEVQTLDAHLKKIGCRMWLWGIGTILSRRGNIRHVCSHASPETFALKLRARNIHSMFRKTRHRSWQWSPRPRRVRREFSRCDTLRRAKTSHQRKDDGRPESPRGQRACTT